MQFDMKTSVLVFGSINKDLILHMDRMPREGENLCGTEYGFANGGKGANQARVFAGLGAETHFLGQVGRDAFGASLAAGLREAGVDVSLLREAEGLRSGLAVILLEASGKNRIAVYPEANLALKAEAVTEALQGKRFDLCVSQLEMDDEAIVTFLNESGRSGAMTVLDCGPARKFDLERVRGVTVVSPNESECEVLTGIFPGTDEEAERAARRLYEIVRPEYVVIKCGERGSVFFDGSRFRRYPALRVPVRDTTCAGDVFTAVFAKVLFETGDADRAMRLATAGGAFAVTQVGAEHSVPTPEQLENMEGTGL